MSTESESDDDVFVMLDGDGRVFGVDYHDMEFGFRAYRDFVPSKHISALVADAAVVDSPMCPASTFWVACEDMAQPRCALEALAAAVFRTHTSSVGADAFEKGTSGAEWWVQTGKKCPGLHWDKDEACRETSGIFVHPATSTVTYLTGNEGNAETGNAPTLVFDNLTVPEIARHGAGVPGNLRPDPECRRVFASWPRRGKHVAFDGRLLHGVFPELTPGEAHRGDPLACGSRVTFLVNIWLNHRPRDVRRLPDDVARALTPNAEIGEYLASLGEPEPREGLGVTGVFDDSSPKTLREPLRDRFFGWSGDEMRLDGALPLALMREEGGRGVGGVAEVDLDRDVAPPEKRRREAMRVVENAVRGGDEAIRDEKDEKDAKRTKRT